jgi:hypothetical protein
MAGFREKWEQSLESYFVRDASGRTAFLPWRSRAYWLDSPEREQEIRRAHKHLLVAARALFVVVACLVVVKGSILRIIDWACFGLIDAYIFIVWPLTINRLARGLERAPDHDRERPAWRPLRRGAAGRSAASLVLQMGFWILVAVAFVTTNDGHEGALIAAGVFFLFASFFAGLLVVKLRMRFRGEPEDPEEVKATELVTSMNRYLMRPFWLLLGGLLLWMVIILASKGH